jgi:hypothetical protein
MTPDESLLCFCLLSAGLSAKLLESAKAGSGLPADIDVVVTSPSAGLGNRLTDIVSAYVVALLTKRVLLVDHGAQSRLYDPQFPVSYEPVEATLRGLPRAVWTTPPQARMATVKPSELQSWS